MKRIIILNLVFFESLLLKLACDPLYTIPTQYIKNNTQYKIRIILNEPVTSYNYDTLILPKPIYDKKDSIKKDTFYTITIKRGERHYLGHFSCKNMDSNMCIDSILLLKSDTNKLKMNNIPDSMSFNTLNYAKYIKRKRCKDILVKKGENCPGFAYILEVDTSLINKFYPQIEK